MQPCDRQTSGDTKAAQGACFPPCISGRVFMFSLCMCGCMCVLRASMCMLEDVGEVCVHRVFIYCSVWGLSELRCSIFTRCHSHTGRIINTQTHSHTYTMHALYFVRLHVHMLTHTFNLFSFLHSEGRANHCNVSVLSLLFHMTACRAD